MSPSINEFVDSAPNVADIGGPFFYVIGYVDAAVVVSDVEVNNPLVFVSELAFWL